MLTILVIQDVLDSKYSLPSFGTEDVASNLIPRSYFDTLLAIKDRNSAINLKFGPGLNNSERNMICNKCSGGSRISRWEGGASNRFGAGGPPLSGCFLAKTCVKMKELDPVQGVGVHAGGTPLDQPMDKCVFVKTKITPVVGPGFPMGGHQPAGGGVDLRRVHFLAKMYVKMKEIDPVGGARRRRPPPPGSANEHK